MQLYRYHVSGSGIPSCFSMRSAPILSLHCAPREEVLPARGWKPGSRSRDGTTSGAEEVAEAMKPKQQTILPGQDGEDIKTRTESTHKLLHGARVDVTRQENTKAHRLEDFNINTMMSIIASSLPRNRDSSVADVGSARTNTCPADQRRHAHAQRSPISSPKCITGRSEASA